MTQEEYLKSDLQELIAVCKRVIEYEFGAAPVDIHNGAWSGFKSCLFLHKWLAERRKSGRAA